MPTIRPRKGEEEEVLPTPAQKREVLFSTIVMWTGITMGALGVYYMALARMNFTPVTSMRNAAITNDL